MSAEPRLLAELPVQRRVRIPKAAGIELAARYRTAAAAQQRLNDYLAGVVLAKGLRLEQLEGFDDDTNELLVTPPDQAS